VIFHKITVDDKEWIKDRLSVDRFYSTEYCFSTIFHWQDAYGQSLARFDDFAVVSSDLEVLSFGYFGDGDRKRLIAALEEYAASKGQVLRLHSIMEEEKQRLEKLFPGQFEFTAIRDQFDYCYAQEDLANLKGRKYANKRNHINKFILNCPDWRYEAITEDNLPECRIMCVDWYEKRLESTGENMEDEKNALMTAIDHFQEEELIGGLLRVNGKVEAFTIAHPVTRDTVVVHFEKANRDLQGSYPMINQQFVKHSCKDYKRINREDDAGSEALRIAKESYYPNEMLVKYSAVKVK